jgi:hypothetical protein
MYILKETKNMRLENLFIATCCCAPKTPNPLVCVPNPDEGCEVEPNSPVPCAGAINKYQ